MLEIIGIILGYLIRVLPVLGIFFIVLIVAISIWTVAPMGFILIFLGGGAFLGFINGE
ncbi:hypothetical protein [Pseudanabaena sp. Chao 1811]|uniref:hypothetical protein n=1 Tax=Pseudanabaena sp. Chao 1811 TaxID=2963092 RepID=UPI0022F3B636|nr:hypothetical protein [Pseudanabaena sp. Chao 1811]